MNVSHILHGRVIGARIHLRLRASSLAFVPATVMIMGTVSLGARSTICTSVHGRICVAAAK